MRAQRPRSPQSVGTFALLSFTLHSAPCIWFWRYDWAARVWLGCLSLLVIFNGGSFVAYSARKHRRALESIVKAEHDAKSMRRCRNCGYINVPVPAKQRPGDSAQADGAQHTTSTSTVHHRATALITPGNPEDALGVES